MAGKKRPKVKTVNRIKKRGTKVPNKVTAKQAAKNTKKAQRRIANRKAVAANKAKLKAGPGSAIRGAKKMAKNKDNWKKGLKGTVKRGLIKGAAKAALGIRGKKKKR